MKLFTLRCSNELLDNTVQRLNIDFGTLVALWRVDKLYAIGGKSQGFLRQVIETPKYAEWAVRAGTAPKLIIAEPWLKLNSHK